MYKTIEANSNTVEILTTCESISPCLETPIGKSFRPYNQFPGSFTGICISPYSFVPINNHSVLDATRVPRQSARNQPIL